MKNYDKEKEKKKKRFWNYIKVLIITLLASIIENISTKQIQHQEKILMVNKVGYIYRPVGTHLLLMASVAHSSQLWWYFLKLLDLSRQDFFYSTGSIVIETSVCLQDFFLFPFFPITPRYNCLFVFEKTVWPTLVIVIDFSWCH